MLRPWPQSGQMVSTRSCACRRCSCRQMCTAASPICILPPLERRELKPLSRSRGQRVSVSHLLAPRVSCLNDRNLILVDLSCLWKVTQECSWLCHRVTKSPLRCGVLGVRRYRDGSIITLSLCRDSGIMHGAQSGPCARRSRAADSPRAQTHARHCAAPRSWSAGPD